MLLRVSFSGMIFLLLCISIYGQNSGHPQEFVVTKDSTAIIKCLDYAESLNGRDNKKAVELYDLIIERSEKLHFDYGVGEAWLNLSSIDMWKGDCMKSIAAAKTAMSYFRRINDKPKVSHCYFLIGKSFSYLDHADSAMSYLLEGLRQTENVPSKELALLYNLIGRIIFYSYQDPPGLISRALSYHLKGFDISKRYKDTSQLIYGCIYLVDDYLELKETDKARIYFLETLQLAEASKNPHDLAEAYNDACHIYLTMKKVDSSIYYGKLALKYSYSSGDMNNYFQTCLNLGRAYDLANNQAARLSILKTAMKELNLLKSRYIKQYWFYSDYADALYKSGLYKEAYDYYKKNFDLTINEAVFKTNIRTSELEVKYQTAQKEKILVEQRLQLAKKDLQIQKERSYMYLSLSGSVLVFLLAGLLYLRQINRKKEHIRQIQVLQQQKEIQLLLAIMQGEERERSRIAKELHDGIAGLLVGAKLHLTSLIEQTKSAIHLKNFQHIMNLLDEAYTEIRKTSHNLMPEVLLKHGLDEALRRYCNNVSSSNKLMIQYDSWGNIGRYKSSFELSLYRIVQELISNIIKHSKATTALVQLNIKDNLLSIDIEDNGVGFTKETRHEGMGLHNIEMKVKAMDGKIEVIARRSKGVYAYIEFDVTHVITDSLPIFS